ncbi:hypothetical protein PoB_000454100 [Plakobranchus ocellatus]|uniref:Uncharacterized protein n=1 Tax=Plakobranchus ocellatus TaxID=259542 RepID=A0AAV3XR97_9GAST|nr:hypothetical protein PoB_000454100 [Plakobranchus ocellatus]
MDGPGLTHLPAVAPSDVNRPGLTASLQARGAARPRGPGHVGLEALTGNLGTSQAIGPSDRCTVWACLALKDFYSIEICRSALY